MTNRHVVEIRVSTADSLAFLSEHESIRATGLQAAQSKRAVVIGDVLFLQLVASFGHGLNGGLPYRLSREVAHVAEAAATDSHSIGTGTGTGTETAGRTNLNATRLP
jgi:hypothetical protein